MLIYTMTEMSTNGLSVRVRVNVSNAEVRLRDISLKIAGPGRRGASGRLRNNQ